MHQVTRWPPLAILIGLLLALVAAPPILAVVIGAILVPGVAHAAVADGADVVLGLNESDPLVAALTWLLLLCARHMAGDHATRFRLTIPTVAVLLAVALRAGIAAAQGDPVTAETVLRAVIAAAGAVLAHSQFRELVKWWHEPPPVVRQPRDIVARWTRERAPVSPRARGAR